MILSSRVETVPEAKPTVLVIDDDQLLREALGRLVRSVGLDAKLYASVPEFLDAGRPNAISCLVLDVRLPGKSGLDFQRDLVAADIHLPIIFITGHGDIPMSVQAMKRGAIEFLTKPFRDQDFLEAIELGLGRDRARRENDQAVTSLRERFEALTSREREIMIEVARGHLSKQIAFNLGVSEATVKVHRSNMMRKMKADSLPELGLMADKLDLLSKAASS